MKGFDLTQEQAPERSALTAEQAAIISQPPESTIIVEASAGTGKTFTLEKYSRKWKKRGLYLAFNSAIAKDAQRRFPPHVQAGTAHSYAFKALGVGRYKDRLINRLRRNHVRDSGVDLFTPYLSEEAMMRAVLSGLNNFTMDAGSTLMPYHCGIEGMPVQTQDKVLPKIAAAVKRFLDYETSGLPFTHDTYLKRLELYGSIGDVADYLLVDEAQDLSPVLLSLVKNSGKPAVIVGDTYQSIYAFRGAVNAMAAFDAPRFPLSQSWRYGQKIADLANHILTYPTIPLKTPIKGRPGHETRVEMYLGTAPARAFILARTNSRLFEGLVKISVPFHVAGGYEAMASQILSGWALSRNMQYKVTDPMVRSFATWEEMAQEATEDDPDIKRLVKIVTDYGDQIPDIIERLRSLHRTNAQDAHIILSTAHKAKGLEADNVVILDDFPTPMEIKERHVDGKMTQIDYDQEINLLYVALTRAIETLYLSPSLYTELIGHMDWQKQPS